MTRAAGGSETAHVSSDPSNHPQVIDRSAQTRDHSLDFVVPSGQPLSNFSNRELCDPRHVISSGRTLPRARQADLIKLGQLSSDIAYRLLEVLGDFIPVRPRRKQVRQSRCQ